MCVCARVHGSVPEERALGSLELKFTDSSKLPCGALELSLDHLQEQQVLLTPYPPLESQGHTLNLTSWRNEERITRASPESLTSPSFLYFLTPAVWSLGKW